MFSYSYQDFQRDSEILYSHFIDLKKLSSSSEVLEHLHCLFLDGIHYPDPEVLASLHRIVLSKWADQEFHHILNRCCYILINHWWLQANYQQITSQLIHLFKAVPAQSASFQATRRLRELVKQFTQTEQFSLLQQRAQVADQAPPSNQNNQAERIGNFIHRYPSLYPYCLLDWDSSETGQQAVRRLQAQKEKQFEQDLIRYTTDWVLRSKNPHRKSITEIKNPTLLTAKQLELAITQFAGQAEGLDSYQDSAQRCLAELSHATSYQHLKWQIYEYLTASIEHSPNPKYGKHSFNQWLCGHLKEVLPQSDHLQPNGFLLVQTCGQLLDILVASPSRVNHHLIFVDLNNNLGATFTIGLLLKIVLLCRSIKPNLEAIKSYLARRFALMFKHYENQVRSDHKWLIECLDNLTVASTIHFGQEDYSRWSNLLHTRG